MPREECSTQGDKNCGSVAVSRKSCSKTTADAVLGRVAARKPMASSLVGAVDVLAKSGGGRSFWSGSTEHTPGVQWTATAISSRTPFCTFQETATLISAMTIPATNHGPFRGCVAPHKIVLFWECASRRGCAVLVRWWTVLERGCATPAGCRLRNVKITGMVRMDDSVVYTRCLSHTPGAVHL